MGGLSTLTVLFTDVVGSTAQRVALGDDAADALVRRHDALVAEAVTRTGGRVVKGLGDGAMACFGSAADAVGAAVLLQQALQRLAGRATEAERLRVRVGIATGDEREQDGDLYGTPVVEASRLCGAAAGGEVLVAELVRLLARSRSGLEFEPLGELDLRGLPEPVPACRVLWAPAPADTAGPLPLPPVLAAVPASSYVGRTDLLDELTSCWRLAAAGDRLTVLLAGEPGIGKTRTAAELARAVHGEGGLVLFGRCDEGLGAPYQPFVEALEGYVHGAGESARLGRLPAELLRLVPELHEVLPAVGAPVATDVRSEEYRLLEAVTSWLAAASRENGLLLVLDDLHWASRPTLQLLLHVLRRLPEHDGARVLVVATYRDTDVDRAHPLVTALGELRRHEDVRRLVLTGLTAQEVLQLLAEAAAHDLDARTQELGRVLHAETEGNPFFVGEVLRHLVESGAVRRVDGLWHVPDAVDVDIPEGVRDVVGRRVSRLSPQANAVLSVAAVVGREVSVDVLAAVSGLDDGAVCDALDEGVRARLLHETRADHYRFSHALVRTTLYDELSATRRRRVHRTVADVVERLHPDDVVSLAHHLLEAGPDAGDSSRAVRAAMAAGEHGIARRAPADAEEWFRHALELLEDSDDVRAVLEATVGPGRAQRDQGEPGHRETLLDVAARARDAGADDLLVAAVLANSRGWSSLMGRVDDERVAGIEQALAVVPAAAPERARLLALLSAEVAFGESPDRARRLAAEAVALVREVGDDATTAAVLVQACGPAHDPDDPQGWIDLTEEAYRRAAAMRDPGLEVVAALFCAGALLWQGEVARAWALTVRARELAEQCGPTLQWAMEAQVLKFRIAELPADVSAAANDATLALGEAAGDPDRFNWWAAGVGTIEITCNHRASALVGTAQEFADQFPGALAWRAVHALALADGGRLPEAREVLRRHDLTARRLAQEPFPSFGPAVLARVALRLCDADLAQGVTDVLRPHRDRWARCYAGITAPISLPLGLCASVLGRHDDAVALVERACTQVANEGLPTLLLFSEADLAEVLVRRGAPGDRDRVRELCARVAAQADARGCSGVAAAARSLMTG